MTFAELLAQVIGLLDRVDVPYMITGSLASSYHGEPRATRDVDIVIDPAAASLDELVDGLLAAGFYVDRATAHEALARRAQFNAVGQDASKVDFIVRRDRPFSVEEFARRRQVDLLGTPAHVATAEDLIIAKLEWAAGSGSDRQTRDAIGIAAIAEGLDEAYVERWARALGVLDAWLEIRRDAR